MTAFADEQEHAPERRSIFLKFAAFLANAFLIVYAIEAIVSVVDAAVLRVSVDSPFFMAEVWLAALLMLLVLTTILLLFFVPHLPKLVLVPPLLVLVWELIGSPPFVISMADRASGLAASEIQLAVAAFAFLACRLITGGWLLSAARLPHKSHLVIRTLVVAPIFLVFTVVSLAGLLVVGIGAVIEDQTKDYLHFSRTGVEVRETVMRKGDKVVHLIGMVHFAEPRFYRELFASFPPGSLVLAEGVTDRNHLLSKGLAYGGAAHALGLETQDELEQMMLRGGNVEEPSTAEPRSPSSSAARPAAAVTVAKGPLFVRADVDVSEFSPTTIRFLGRVGDVYASATLSEAIDKLMHMSEGFTDADMKAVTDDVVYKRNNKVLAEFDKRMANYQVVYIPWGAEHMPDLETAMKDRGFTVASTRLIPLARYDTIFGGLTH